MEYFTAYLYLAGAFISYVIYTFSAAEKEEGVDGLFRLAFTVFWPVLAVGSGILAFRRYLIGEDDE